MLKPRYQKFYVLRILQDRRKIAQDATSCEPADKGLACENELTPQE